MRLIRSKAAAMGFSPDRVAVMGFSAGGHLAASLTTRFADKTYDRVDAADDLPAKANLSGLIYPVISMDPAIAHAGSRKELLVNDASPERIAAISPERLVTAGLSPVFQLHAADDKTVPVENSSGDVRRAEGQGRADRDARLRGRRPRLRLARDGG
jgi:acetyl esterase/lipase